MKHEGIWVLLVLLFVWLLATVTTVAHGGEVKDQRNHWQLMVIEVDLVAMKIIHAEPANKLDYTHDQCFAFADVLSVVSPDGKYMLAFGCEPKDLIDTKVRK